MAAVTSFQGFVQHADTKAIALVAAHIGGITIMAAQGAAAGAMLERSMPTPVLATCLLGLYVVGLMVSGYRLLAAIRPTTAAPLIASRFSISGATVVTPRPDDLQDQFAEAWELNRLLSRIAEAKHRHIRRAVPWTCATLATTVAWNVCVLVTG
ncbi:hypothetical protein [Nonomuraea indica]|uniref:hypothetical protein n=1 Tax=Nonomuraea indica TaxID=1581193 RepID=UPI000C7D65B9|nr:hypothetical protein [Nonomuraea indica]